MRKTARPTASDVRQTLEYAEAVALLKRQQALDEDRSAIRRQLTFLKRLSREAVEIARYDIDGSVALAD